MPLATFMRNELKFSMTKTQAGEFIAKCSEYMNPDNHCRNGNYYCIYNIYYDTEDNRIVRTSLAHPYYKEKLRLRSYNLPALPEQEVYLEFKKKIGGIVSKRRAAMTLKEAYSFLQSGERPAALKYINEQVVSEIAYFLSQNKVRPAVYIGYKRMAFFGKNNKDFRITLDWDIVTRRDEVSFEKGCYGTKLLDEGRYLMEVKLPGTVPKWLADVLSELKVYKTSFSKFGTEYTNYSRNKIRQDFKTVHEKGCIVFNPDLSTNFHIQGSQL